MEGIRCIVPFNVRDFLDRAAFAYPERTALVDEPDQPADPWPALSFSELADRAGRQAAALDRLGVAPGERVAIVSPNSARLLTSFFGVCGWGRILVPVNFRLTAAEVEFIVDHAEASVLLVDPELSESLSAVKAPHRFVFGAESDEVLFPAGADARAVDGRRNGHRHHQLHLGHHRPAQGRAAHPPQLLGQRRHLRLAPPALGP